ncbi:GHKL domain-containing protein [Clostridium sp. BNL1100]|uniref:sensor histidine kinase n=1 Tax=Clostridium sp. BNL1100 TaxID=755731 RepID=UPI00024A7B95|nr:GHKL domain-containing protein [Clostridium sp. BNL1100]AEY66164.1 histidine kinase [Clostridium sp. BNL1100]
MNPIVRIVINLIDAFILIMYAVVFAKIKIDYRRIILGTITIGLSFVLTFYAFMENYYNNILLQYSISLAQVVTCTFFVWLLFHASFLQTLIGMIVYFAATYSGEMIVMTILTYIKGDFITAFKNSILAQILISLGVYPIMLLVLIISKKLLSVKLIGTIKNKKHELLITVYGISTISITTVNTMIAQANRLNVGEMVVSIGTSIFFLLMNIVFLYFITKFTKREQELEYQKHYNKSLGDIVNQLSAFKHNFDNMLATMSGYIEFGKWEGLTDFVNEIRKKQTTIGLHNISMLKKINEPGIIGLFLSKLDAMRENGVYCNIIVDNEICVSGMKIGDLCDCLGVLVDNALESASEIENGFVKIKVETIENTLIFLIQNSTGLIEVDRIFEQGWSTKGEGRGFGLWHVMNIIRTYPNVLFNTTLKNDVISQELIISKSIL